MFSAAYIAAENTALPRLTGAVQLPKALTLNNARHSVASPAGGPLGGVLLGLASWLPLLANALGSLLGAGTAALIRQSITPRHTDATDRWSVSEIVAGSARIARMPPLRTYAVVASLNSIGGGAILVALPLYWAGAGVSAERIGAYAFAFAAAGLLGALVATPVVAKLRLGVDGRLGDLVRCGGGGVPWRLRLPDRGSVLPRQLRLTRHDDADRVVDRAERAGSGNEPPPLVPSRTDGTSR